MKYLFLKTRIVVLLLMMVSASAASAQEANEREVINEMTYSIGKAQTQGLKEYLVNSLGVDLDFFSSFVKGLKDGVEQAKSKDKKAYYAGIQIGEQIANRMIPGINNEVFGDSVNIRIPISEFMKGFIAGLDAPEDELNMASSKAAKMISQVKSDRMLKLYSGNKIAGEKFLDQNKTKPGIKVFPSGLQYKVLRRGTGRIPKETDLVKVHYEGKTLDGVVFDSSYKQGKPAKLRPNQVIEGWTEALTNMPTGSIWEVFIPQELAYGAREQSKIKPFSALVFKIELISIEK